MITSRRKTFVSKSIDKLEKYDESLISRLPRFTFRTNLSSVWTAILDAMWNRKSM